MKKTLITLAAFVLGLAMVFGLVGCDIRQEDIDTILAPFNEQFTELDSAVDTLEEKEATLEGSLVTLNTAINALEEGWVYITPVSTTE